MNEIKIIIEAKKSKIKFDNKRCVRNNTPNYIDITMGILNSAQVSDLVGIYLLSHLYNEFSESRDSFYRDNVLLILKITSNRWLELLNKNMFVI